MTTPVSFPLAKLLKERGFNAIDCSGYYHICDGYTKGYAHCYSDVNTQQETAILAPTIAEVVMWLYEKHGIWINVWSDTNLNLPEFFRPSAKWFYVINCDLSDSYNLQTGKPKQLYDSPTEAYEAGIEYTLNNLI